MLVENAPYPQDIRVYHEAESLAAAGQRVTVLAPRASGQPTREVINGVIVRRFDLPWAATRAAWTYLLEYVVAHAQLLRLTAIELVRGARVVHFHGPPDTLFVAGLLARLARRKVIFDFHDSAPELFRAKFGSTRAIGLLVRAQRYAAMCADHVIVTNETQRDIVHALVDRPQEEVSVIRNGPRASDFHGEFERGSTNGHPVHGRDVAPEGWSLAYLGVLDVQDGVLELVDLLQAPELSAAHLTVIGSGPLRAEFQERVRRAGLQERVTLTGFVPHAHVPALLARCDIGLDLAPGTELNHGSTMVKVVEYLAAGVPVVSFDLLETRRTAGDAALYAPPGDLAAFAGLVARLARDPALRAELSRRGLERALAGLMWEHSEEELLRVYSRLLNGGVDEFPVPALADQQGPKLG